MKKIKKRNTRNKQAKKYKPSRFKHYVNLFFQLNTGRLLIILGIWILLVIGHNIISALYGKEEAVLFILSGIIIPLYLLVAIILFIRGHKRTDKS